MNENISLYMTGIKTVSGVDIEIDDKEGREESFN